MQAPTQIDTDFNPIRKLFALVSVRAVKDLHANNTPNKHRHTARTFLAEYADTIACEFSIPVTKITQAQE